ncbi:MAG: hypothetical protein D6805_10100, partial [Planctomycetota bacterium]
LQYKLGIGGRVYTEKRGFSPILVLPIPTRLPRERDVEKTRYVMPKFFSKKCSIFFEINLFFAIFSIFFKLINCVIP